MSNPDIISLYSQGHQGGELPYFVGKQYGSGWLRTIGRFAFPILKRLGLAAVGTAQDVLMKNKPLLPSLKSHAIEAAGNIVSPFMENNSRKRKHSTKHKHSINKHQKTGTIFEK